MPSRSGTKANFVGTNEVERLIGKAAFLKGVNDSEKVHVYLSLGKSTFRLKEGIKLRLVLHNQTGNSIFIAAGVFCESGLTGALRLIELPKSFPSESLSIVDQLDEAKFGYYLLTHMIESRPANLSNSWYCFNYTFINYYMCGNMRLDHPLVAREIKADSSIVVEWPDINQVFEITRPGHYALAFDDLGLRYSLFPPTRKICREWTAYVYPMTGVTEGAKKIYDYRTSPEPGIVLVEWIKEVDDARRPGRKVKVPFRRPKLVEFWVK